MKMGTIQGTSGHASALKKVSALKYEDDTTKGEPVPAADPDTESGKDELIANAMGNANVETLSADTVAGMKTHFGGVNADPADMRSQIWKVKNEMGSGASEKAWASHNARLDALKKTARSRYPKYFHEKFNW